MRTMNFVHLLLGTPQAGTSSLRREAAVLGIAKLGMWVVVFESGKDGKTDQFVEALS